MEEKLLKIYLLYYNLLIAQYIASSLSNLVNNISEKIHRIKCKYGLDDENLRLVELKISYCKHRYNFKKQKIILKRIFFKLMNNVAFGKTMENVRKHRDIKLVLTERRINYLVSEPNLNTKKFSTENLLVIETKKTEIFMNKPVYLGISILE